MTKNKWVWVLGGVIILGILFYIPRRGKQTITTDVPCLIANIPLQQHIHPILKITVDGVSEAIPANIGLASCERALHTHDETGTLHTEAQDSREYILDDFFTVWGKTIERKGYIVSMTVDKKQNTELGSLKLKDKQEIILEYRKK